MIWQVTALHYQPRVRPPWQDAGAGNPVAGSRYWKVLEQYQYDADGLRIAKLNGTGEVQEKYFYNGGKLSYVTDGSDKLLYYFTRSTSGALLSMVDCTGAQKVILMGTFLCPRHCIIVRCVP